MTASFYPLLVYPLLVVLALAALPGQAQREVRWKKTVLDPVFRAEGVTVADVNRDGKLDIIAGNLWYEAPNWTPHEILPVKEYEPATGYSECFLTFAYDVDGDGWPDQIVVGFPGAPATWRRNPGRTGVHWEEFPITSSACNESPIFADITGDGKPELITPFNESQMAFYRPGKTPREGWEQFLVGEPGKPGVARFAHGLGVGDVNGDGRPDILCNGGYYEAPVDPTSGPWKFVAAPLGPDCAQMHALDLNGSGIPDVISSSAHNIGVWWHEQRRGPDGPEFTRHVIDDTFSQSHSLEMVDINRDGQPDFVTGKRWWAHGPEGDVNPNDPAMLYWYEYRRQPDGEVRWVRHEIDSDSGVGTQFTVADINGSGRPDIITANKKGVFLFEQQ
jgi:hypothetical protein